jgi:hypothetical protein
MKKSKLLNILLGISIVYFSFITISLLIEYRESIWEWKEKITKVEQTNPVPHKNEVKETEKIPPKVKETYNFIKGKKFKGKVATQRTEYGAIDQYEYLTFNPVTETEGDVYSVVEWEEWGLAGGGKGTVAKNSTSYYIREDGKIIFRSCVLEKNGYSLKSNLKTNDGYTIIYN